RGGGLGPPRHVGIGGGGSRGTYRQDNHQRQRERKSQREMRRARQARGRQCEAGHCRHRNISLTAASTGLIRLWYRPARLSSRPLVGVKELIVAERRTLRGVSCVARRARRLRNNPIPVAFASMYDR